jgi:hypothetical protein
LRFEEEAGQYTRRTGEIAMSWLVGLSTVYGLSMYPQPVVPCTFVEQ